MSDFFFLQLVIEWHPAFSCYEVFKLLTVFELQHYTSHLHITYLHYVVNIVICESYFSRFTKKKKKNRIFSIKMTILRVVNPLTSNDPYRGRTAPLTSKHCTLYIYSTNISTEYFKHGIYSPFFLFKMQFVS